MSIYHSPLLHRIIALFCMLGALGFCLPAHAEDTLRPEVGKPLQAAQELMQAKKYKEAQAKVNEADAIANKTPYESFIVERMRGAVSIGVGDSDAAMKSFEATIASGRLPAADQLKLIEAVAGTAYNAKDYARAIKWSERYFQDGGSNPQMRAVLLQSRYLGGDLEGAIKELTASIAAAEAANSVPAEDQLQLLGSCYLKLNDKTAYVTTLEKLVNYHPKKEYWAELLARLQRKPGFADRMTLDVYRLMRVTGNLSEAGDYVEMVQMAMQAGLPAEAKRVVEEGYSKGLLGKGPEQSRHKRLRDLASKQVNEDTKSLASLEDQAKAAATGSPLVALGFAYVSNQQYDKGIALMEWGVAKGKLKHPDLDRLHLGIAYLQAGNKEKAQQMLRTVQGQDGSEDIAKLWLIQGWK